MKIIAHARSALSYLNPSCSREEWIKIAMAVKAASLTFDDFHDWSKHAENYKGEQDCRKVWDSIKEHRGISEGTLFYEAIKAGYKGPNKGISDYAHNSVEDIWQRCLPASSTHDYIMRKKGITNGLGCYPDNAEPLIINGVNVAGYLVVPCISNGKIQTLQFIPPQKDKTKLNLSKTSFNDGFFLVGTITNSIYICEGLGQAWAVYQATGIAAVNCFGAGRMKKVASILRKQYPNASLIIVPDRGKENLASDIAVFVLGTWMAIPPQFPENYDVNDYLIEHGSEALQELLIHPKVDFPLDVIFADELSNEFVPPDELVEGVLTVGDGSILYGDSNCGKTFFVIDLACAVALGIGWMGRHTEEGLVLYLAAESPASVKRRLQAYQKYHNVKIANFVVVQNPINLFDNEADTNAIVQLVQLIEKQRGQKVRLIIGDTLARLSAGANESAGQDMGLVIRHFDRIRNECKAHFMLIHHSGKNAAAGARGWSGVRAAVDTEIEVTDSPGGRCSEITKQRDLGTKGVRIGFRLEVITLGLTKWKSPATSCVVVPINAPPKSTGKRVSEIGGAIIEYMRSQNKALKKSDIRKHFAGRYTSGGIYRQIKALKEAGVISEVAGYISLVPIGANECLSLIGTKEN